MDVRLLGPLEVRSPANEPVRLGGPRQRTLFGLLALRAPHVVSTPQLIDGIWDEEPPASATRTLHAHVAYLRRTLSAAGLDRSIVTRPPGYALVAEPEQVDAHRFTDLVRRGRTALQAGAAAEAARSLGDALGMWRGDVLADCPVGEWARAEVAALREARLYATEDLLAARVALGEHAHAAAELEGLVTREPLRERFWELLMVALHRGGRQGDALGAYRRARAVLAEELGVEPGAALRELEAAILAGDDLGRAGPAGPLVVAADATPAPDAGSLPNPLTSLIGRRAEIDEVGQVLDRRRLVTLTGVGGCGKTRLAIAVGGEVADRYDSVRFVDLSAVLAVDSLAVPVAAALGVRERPDLDPVDLLAYHLRPLRTLVVLDNCEHLVEACADLLGTLLRRCPGLSVLATSREVLGVPGELAWPVPALSVPTDAGAGGLAELRRHESVQLFLDRAAVPAVRALTDADAPALAAVCAGLDGLPLAVELAAARTSVLTVPEIAERIRDPALLRATIPGRRPQHSALDAAMEWSYRLLEPEVRTAFRDLAVFGGGFTLDAAQAVWDRPREAALDLLADLVAKSLVVVERHRATARYRQLETIRHYAAERLAKSPDGWHRAHCAHAAYYRALAEDIGQNPHGPELDALLDRTAAEEDNLMSAIAWYAEHGPPADELRFATALGHYFHLRGRYRDGRRALEQALRRDDGTAPADRARALVSAANMAFLECDYAAAAGHGERALAAHRALGNPRGVARSLSLLASVDRERGHYDRALARSEDAAVAYRDAEDEPGVADALQMAGFAAWLTGDLVEAESLVTDALKRFQVLGDPEGIASARVHLAAVAHYAGDPARARWLAEDAQTRFTELGFKEGIAWAMNILGLVAHREGDREQALAALRSSLDLHCAVGDRWRSASVLDALAAVLADGDPVTAAELLAAADAIRGSIDAPVPPQERNDRDAATAAVRAALTDREFYGASARGAAMSLSDLPALLPNRNGREDARTAPPALGHRDPG